MVTTMDTSSCRICCKPEPFDPVWIISWHQALKETILDMFTYCTQLDVSSGDSLPQQICQGCLRKLTVAYEFRKLCRQSDVTYREQLRDGKVVNLKTRAVSPEPESEPEGDQSDGSFTEELPIEETAEEPASDTSLINPDQKSEDNKLDPPKAKPLIFLCCFKRCNERTKEYEKLREHAKKQHSNRRHGNARRRPNDHRFVCRICLGGFSSREQWKVHKTLYQRTKKVFECTRCGEPFNSEERLATHEMAARCKVEEELVGESDEQTAIMKNLIQKIVKAKWKDDLVRLSPQEHTIVKNRTFLERLHRNELKYSRKEVKVYYVCEICPFQTATVKQMKDHLKDGSCGKGYYIALGFCHLVMRQIRQLECESCGYQCSRNYDMLHHQSSNNHSGIRRSLVTRHVAERNFPCEFCGRILSTTGNRKRHWTNCRLASEKKAANRVAKETVGEKSVNMEAEEQSSNDCDDDDQEPIVSEIKIEENDPLEVLDQPANDPVSKSPLYTITFRANGTSRRSYSCTMCNYVTNARGNINRHCGPCLRRRELGLPALRWVRQPKAKRDDNSTSQLFSCVVCGYSTDTRGNYNRHMKRCLEKFPPKQSTYFGSSEEGEAE